MFNDNKGIASILAILIAIALSIVLSGSFIQITSSITRTMISKTNLNPYITVTKGSIRIYNQYPVCISLKDLKLIINGNVTRIEDENGNGIWDPGEYISIPLPNSSIVEVELIYRNSLIYHAIFVKPEVLELDKSFPTLKVTSAIAGNFITLNVTAKDDLAVKDLSIFAVNVFGKRTALSKKNTIHRDLAARITEFLHGHKSALKPLERISICKRFNLTELREEKVVYLLVRVTDLSGKVSQKIVVIPTSYPIVEVSPKDGTVFWTTSDKEAVKFSVRAMDYYGIKYLNTSGAFNVNRTFNSRIAKINRTVILGLGYHTLRVEATNVFGRRTLVRIRILVRHDYPPSVVILQPGNGEIVRSRDVRLIARLYDDHSLKEYSVYVNGELVARGSIYGREYTISKVVTLDNGSNVITVTARDVSGQMASDNVTVTVATPPNVRLIVNSTVIANVRTNVTVLASSRFGIKNLKVYIGKSKYSYSFHGAKSVRIVVPVVFSPGVHVITAVASNGYYSSKVSKGVRAIRVFVRTRIVYPRNGTRFITGDPEFSAVAVSNFKPTITLYLDNKKLSRVRITPILAGDVFSTGWIVTPAEVYIPPIRGRSITITSARFTGVSSTERPVIGHGIGSSVSFAVNTPSTVIITLYSVYGRAVKIVSAPRYRGYTYVGGWSRSIERVWSFVAPPGAVPDSGVITVTAYGNIPGVSRISIGSVKKEVTIYPGSTVRLAIPRRELVSLLEGRASVKTVDEDMGYGFGSDVDRVLTHTDVEISYHTVARNITVLVNGHVIRSVREINESLVEIRLNDVHGVISVRGEGTFGYNILVIPERRPVSSHLTVILPNGTEVRLRGRITIPFTPGLFRFKGWGIIRLSIHMEGSG